MAAEARRGQPEGEVEPRRLDYLLVRGLYVERSARLALREHEHGASDHELVWADLAWD